MNSKRPRRLDLNAPLLSTRRTPTAISEKSRKNSLEDSSDRLPFSWEQTPGKPKHNVITSLVENDVEVKALPIRGQEDAAFDGFSDVVDSFSLHESPWDDLDLGDVYNIIGGDNYYEESPSPSYMLERFLPAATAIAASTLSSLANEDNNYDDFGFDIDFDFNYGKDKVSRDSRVGEQGFSCSSKGCGLKVFIHSRIKHRICGAKNPIRRVGSTFKHHFSRMNN